MNISLANLIKLYYRNNKLSVLSDIDDTDSINNDIPVKHINNMPYEHIVAVFRNAILNQSNSVSSFVRNEINTSDLKYDNIVKAENKIQLLLLLYTGIILLGHQGNFNWIDTSSITDMEGLFEDSVFNGDISRWDVSNVENMNKMFHNAYLFNLNISNWDVSNVKTANYMFCNAKTFNLDISNWNVFNMQSMHGMFNGAISFNLDISTWCIQSHCDCEHIIDNTMLTYDKLPVKIFENTANLLADLDDENLDLTGSILAKSMNNKIDCSVKCLLTNAIQTGNIHSRLKRLINDHNNFHTYKGIIKANNKEHLKQLIEIGLKLLGNDGNFNWIDTSKITDMSSLFDNNRVFNGHIELWDVRHVTDMRNMFRRTFEFNQPIGDWDVSNVTNMGGMFLIALNFNQPIGNWDVSRVIDMNNMFYGARSFNLPIGDWDVSRVTIMTLMFYGARLFNLPIGDWDVSSVTDMACMFEGAQLFNQPIGDWDISNVRNMGSMFCYAKSFNQQLHNWVIPKSINIYNMFAECPIKEEYKPVIL